MKKLNNIVIINITVIVLLLLFKCYTNISMSEFMHYNYQSIDQLQDENTDSYSFAVTDQVQTNLFKFNSQIIPGINGNSEIKFVVSPGNAVLDGSQIKYNQLYKMYSKLEVPIFTVIGEREATEGGDSRYFEHFGNYYFSFEYSNSLFIALDSTGTSDMEEEASWLNAKLEKEDYDNTFVFLNGPLYKGDNTQLESLTSALAKADVTTVFYNGNIKGESYSDGIQYISTGNSANHAGSDQIGYYVVSVENGEVDIDYNQVSARFSNNFKSLFSYVISILYIQIWNIILVLSISLLVLSFIKNKMLKEQDYYRDFYGTLEEASKGKKLNIAMFTNNYYPFIGGVPISIDQLVTSLRADGHTVTIFAPQYPEIYEEEDGIVRIKLLIYHKYGNFQFAIANIFSKEYKKSFRAEQYDLVHIHHAFWLGKAGYRLAKRDKIPVVLTYHTRLEMYSENLPIGKTIFKNYFSHKMAYRFGQRCDGIICPSNSTREYLENIRVGTPKLTCPTGIDFKKYSVPNTIGELREGEEVILCSVARLSIEKNIDFIIEALSVVKQNTHVKFKLYLIGDGPERQNLRQKVTELGLTNEVVFVGSVSPDKVASYYKQSDIFVFGSKSETQGMVLLEAMAGSCPVVCINASGVDDVVVNGYNGYKTLDDRVNWSKRLIELMEKPQLRKKLSENALSYAHEYSMDVVSDNIVEFYESVIARKRG